MMGTGRRTSLVGLGSSPTSNSAATNLAIPRDFHPSTTSYDPSHDPINSPDRKRRRSDLASDLSSYRQPEYSSSSHHPYADNQLKSHDNRPGAARENVAETDKRAKRQRSYSSEFDKSHNPSENSSKPNATHPSAWADGSNSESREGFTRPSDASGPSRPFTSSYSSTQNDHARGPEINSSGRRLDSLDASPTNTRRSSNFVGARYAGTDRVKSEFTDPLLAARRMPPPRSAGSRSPPPPPHRLPSLHHGPSSPPPRLPSFASLDSDHIAARGKESGISNMASGPSNLFQSGANISPRRAPLAYRSTAPYSPFPVSQNRTPSMSHASPSPSTMYGNPPMIHPSLAGLPGAGGGPGGKQQPSFVSKLYSMLEDPSIEELISWGSAGTVFSVTNPVEFSRLVLPNWFKHSNWQSFVRQLNMYGFHKVNHSYQGNPTDEVQVWEFRHPSFRRGEIGLLNDIKRKSSRQKRAGSPSRSLAENDLRADRSGGSSTPSPKVPLVAIPGGGDMMVMPPGMHRSSRDYFYADERGGTSIAGHDPRTDPRRFPMEPHTSPYADQYGRLPKEPSVGMGPVPGGGHPAAPPPFYEERRHSEIYMDRAESIARFDDLSDRTDAIIRHASFLESQVRILAEQLNDSRLYAQQCVRDEMSQLLNRLERSLNAPSPAGKDPVQRMHEVVRSQLSFLQPQHRRSDPMVDTNRSLRGANAPHSPPTALVDVKRPSV